MEGWGELLVDEFQDGDGDVLELPNLVRALLREIVVVGFLI